MNHFLISLDEVERVKRLNNIPSTVELAKRTGIARSTWSRALSTRKPTPDVLDALAKLGAKASRVLISEDMAELSSAA